MVIAITVQPIASGLYSWWCFHIMPEAMSVHRGLWHRVPIFCIQRVLHTQAQAVSFQCHWPVRFASLKPHHGRCDSRYSGWHSLSRWLSLSRGSTSYPEKKLMLQLEKKYPCSWQFLLELETSLAFYTQNSSHSVSLSCSLHRVIIFFRECLDNFIP